MSYKRLYGSLKIAVLPGAAARSLGHVPCCLTGSDVSTNKNDVFTGAEASEDRPGGSSQPCRSLHLRCPLNGRGQLAPEEQGLRCAAHRQDLPQGISAEEVRNVIEEADKGLNLYGQQRRYWGSRED